ncbi:ParM/StbA family protein [Priestia endophytica]|uniref:ParM/StbA family protein n=1 Tax=Priestia endophytica TaxID=135735 RepID=UPI003D2AC67F
MGTNMVRDVYAIDLGNGFAKRMWGTKSKAVDPSVFAVPLGYFNTVSDKLISVSDNKEIYIGQDAFDSGHLVENAIGEEDIERYSSQEYKDLLFGFMAKDCKADTTIQLLILGLPVKHFRNKREELTKLGQGKKMVKVGENQIVLDIKQCIVVPQPLGTYMYLESLKKIDTAAAKTLVIDGGSGTLDVTEMKGREVISYDGSELGMNSPYEQILTYLETEYNGIDITVNHIPDILENGLRYAGGNIKVADMKPVVQILDNHFTLVWKRIIQKYKSFNKFDHVVWTGGLALSHKSRIEARKIPNFMILKDGQTANVEGFFDFGKGLVDSGREKGTVQSK